MKEYVLKTNALTKSYKGVNALDKVTLSLELGKIYGLIAFSKIMRNNLSA